MVKDLLKEGIITPTQNFNYNSPVWPVQKPNGKWRFTVDYRKINELSPKMPGQLPDVEDINLRIRQNSPQWLASIDLTDMFFGIPLHPDSQEFTTFTWQNKQYKFLRLPQGYLNSPIIAHSALTTTLKDFEPIGDTLYDSYIDNVIIYGSVKEDVDKTLQNLITHLRTQGWTINPDKIQPVDTKVKFLGVEWSTQGPTIPQQVIVDKIQNLSTPTTKTQAQHVIGMFGYWRQYIPYLQLILQPLYKITRKSEAFDWGTEQKKLLIL